MTKRRDRPAGYGNGLGHDLAIDEGSLNRADDIVAMWRRRRHARGSADDPADGGLGHAGVSQGCRGGL
jgi:hypothetical protein